MYEYMRGLHQQFFKEPDFPELRQEINEIHQALTEGKAKPERRKLLKLVDMEAELSTEPPYSFAEEEERRMGQQQRRDD